MTGDEQYREALGLGPDDPLPGALGQVAGHARSHARSRYIASGPPRADTGEHVGRGAGGTDLAKAVQLALIVADDLEDRGYLAVGAIRLLAQLAARHAAAGIPQRICAAPDCEKPVFKKAKGPEKIYCSEKCRKRAARARAREDRAFARDEYRAVLLQ